MPNVQRFPYIHEISYSSIFHCQQVYNYLVKEIPNILEALITSNQKVVPKQLTMKNAALGYGTRR